MRLKGRPRLVCILKERESRSFCVIKYTSLNEAKIVRQNKNVSKFKYLVDFEQKGPLILFSLNVLLKR